MSARTRAQTRNTGYNAFSSSILFHETATNRTDLLGQFRDRPKLFLMWKITDRTMEKVYLIVQFRMLGKNLSPGDLAAMLSGVDKRFTFVAFEKGR